MAPASTINGDWWELTNTGDTAINLAGFQWADTEDALPSTDSNFFPSFIINPGQSIIILEENTSNEAAWLTNWGLDSSVVILAMDEMVDDSTPDGDTFSGLSSSGDGVFFYNPLGQLLSSFSYGSAIRGTSFEISKSGVSLGNSVVGEFGAVKAANNDVGSPGTAVPEPVTMSLLSLALGGLLLRRRTH
ncbi:MAG: lamin tail domain-containing protein [Phycisphaerales bacterium]|nr:lamin tail domain-containing protein [Phycisphaerales bacterium]